MLNINGVREQGAAMECEWNKVHHAGDKPGQALDYITVALILAFTIPFVVGNFLMIWHKDYVPIKSKSVDLTVLSSLGGLIWVAATLVVNNHFRRRKNSVWSVCPLWTFWLQATFGFSLWLNCFILRLLNLHCILIRQRSAVKPVALPLLVLLSPIIVFSTFATAFRVSRFSNHENHDEHQPPPFENFRREGDCIIMRGWAIGLIIVLPLYFLIFIGLAISLRNIRPQYNEFRLIRNGGIISVFLFLLSLVTFQTHVYREVTGRSFLAIAVSGAVFYYFWARNWEVLFSVLFHKEEYLKKFIDRMNTIPRSGQLGICNSYPLQDENCFHLWATAKDEADALQAEIDGLRKDMLDLNLEMQKEVQMPTISLYRYELCTNLDSGGLVMTPIQEVAGNKIAESVSEFNLREALLAETAGR